ncbi:hypothetical protein M9458_036694, partial [Cirrhinus mrigala]
LTTRHRRTDHTIMNQTGVDPFQELVDSVHRVLTPPVTATPVPVPSQSTSSSGPIYAASPMANPAPYSGLADECNDSSYSVRSPLRCSRIVSPLRELKSCLLCHYYQPLNLCVSSWLISSTFSDGQQATLQSVSNCIIFNKANPPYKIMLFVVVLLQPQVVGMSAPC